jgi:hypothetical protein
LRVAVVAGLACAAFVVLAFKATDSMDPIRDSLLNVLCIIPILLLGLVGPALLYPLLRRAGWFWQSHWEAAAVACAALAVASLLGCSVWACLKGPGASPVLWWPVSLLFLGPPALLYTLTRLVRPFRRRFFPNLWRWVGIGCAAATPALLGVTAWATCRPGEPVLFWELVVVLLLMASALYCLHLQLAQPLFKRPPPCLSGWK